MPEENVSAVQPRMNVGDYIVGRLNDQIDWYDRKSIQNQRWFKRLRLAEIVLAASIPFLSGLTNAEPWSKWLIGLFGVAISVIAAALGLFKFEQNWVEYRTTCETLKKEKYLYLMRAALYGGSNTDEENATILTQQVEGIISRQNTDWSRYVAQNREEKRDRDETQTSPEDTSSPER